MITLIKRFLHRARYFGDHDEAKRLEYMLVVARIKARRKRKVRP